MKTIIRIIQHLTGHAAQPIPVTVKPSVPAYRARHFAAQDAGHFNPWNR